MSERKQLSRARRRLLQIGCTLAFAAAMLFAASAMTTTTASAQMLDQATQKKAAEHEIHFMTHMIDHHYLAVKMAGICLRKDIPHEEVHDMCHEIVNSQMSEIHTMQTWLMQWYGIHHQPQLPSGGQEMLNQLQSLDGAKLEIQFMEMMIPHHAMAIEMSNHCLQHASHTKLLNMCKTIIVSQAKEIRTMRGWLCAWYNICELKA